MDDEAEAKSFMEMCVQQEEGTSGGFDVRADSPSSDDDNYAGRHGSGGGGETGTGVTVATSKARMWLAKHAMRTGDYSRAMQFATELCQDGVEVEEAKALVREVRVRLEVHGA